MSFRMLMTLKHLLFIPTLYFSAFSFVSFICKVRTYS